MEQLLKSAIYQGVYVDCLFQNEQPVFGDLFQICGYDHPEFPASGKFDFSILTKFGFKQVDDFFGVTSDEEEGDEVVTWLYPLVNGKVIYHHPGPFSGVRLSFNVLRNTAEQGEFFLQVVKQFSQTLSVKTLAHIIVVQAHINQITEYWRSEDIEPSSSEALQLKY